MDRTAVASVVIGLGATIAAMVFPTRYPNAPKWAVSTFWYTGVILILIGASYLVVEHPLSGLILVITTALVWFWGGTVALSQLPGFWLLVMFAAGIAVQRWVIPWARKGVAQYHTLSAVPAVASWLVPRQAIEQFMNPELLLRQQKAESRLADCAAVLQDYEYRLQQADESERELLKEKILVARDEKNMAEYVAKLAHTDLFWNFYNLLGSKVLIAKGNEIKKGKTREWDTLIPFSFWKLITEGRDLIDLDSCEAHGMYQHYKNVMIGKPIDS